MYTKLTKLIYILTILKKQITNFFCPLAYNFGFIQDNVLEKNKSSNIVIQKKLLLKENN